MALGHILAAMTSDTIVTFEISLVTPLTSSPVMWHREHLWNFNVHQSPSLVLVIVIAAAKKIQLDGLIPSLLLLLWGGRT
jgi:hypothetical protein